MTLGKKNVRAACPKEMLKFFRARLMYVGCSCTKVLERNWDPVLYLLFQICNVHVLNDLSYKPFLSRCLNLQQVLRQWFPVVTPTAGK